MITSIFSKMMPNFWPQFLTTRHNEFSLKRSDNFKSKLSRHEFFQRMNVWIHRYFIHRCVFVCFLEEIEVTKKSFRNYLTFRGCWCLAKILYPSLKNLTTHIAFSVFKRNFIGEPKPKNGSFSSFHWSNVFRDSRHGT